MLGYAFDQSPVELWLPHLGGMPVNLLAGVQNPDILKIAWNVNFEYCIFKYLLKLPIPIEQWDDAMIRARYCSMPGYLEDVSKILDIQHKKMAWGTKSDPGEAQKLLRMFCMPAVKGGRETLFGIEEPWFKDWESHPDEFNKFCAYCKLDVEGEREVYDKLEPFALPVREREGWLLDHRINERGMPADRDYVYGASTVAAEAKIELDAKLKKLTGLENPNSRDQMLPWLRSHGYPFNSLNKSLVTRAEAEAKLDPEAKTVIDIRKQATKISDSKLEAMKNVMAPDERFRFQFNFMGAPRTGRESSHTIQMQNMPRPTKQIIKNMDRILELLRRGQYDPVWGPVMDAVTGTLRAAFKAPDGSRLVVSDLGSIENRVLAWLANCPSALGVFLEGKDPYLDFAETLYGIPYAKLIADYNAGDLAAKEMRQNSKPPVLGCGYMLGAGVELLNEDGDLIKTGLWGYSHGMGVPMTQEQCQVAVQVYRNKYPEICDFWYDMEGAALEALKTRSPQTVRFITFDTAGKVLRMTLPSGRCLHYIRPQIEEVQINGRWRENITYEGVHQKTRQWTRIKTYGGKLVENATQAVARDVLFHGMFLADQIGLDIVGTAHDEIITVVPDWAGVGLDDLVGCMTETPDWAPGLPLSAEGYESVFYRKG